MLHIPAPVLHALQAHGEAAYPNEGAGLLLGQVDPDGAERRVQALYPIVNQWDAAEQFHRYLITPADLLAGENEAARHGLDVIGIFHSHPDHVAEPSAMDGEWALPWFSYIITSVAEGQAVLSRSWRLRDDRSAFDEEVIRPIPVEPAAPDAA